MDLSLHTTSIETIALTFTGGGGLTGIVIYALRQYIRRVPAEDSPTTVLPPPETRPLITDRRGEP